MSVLCVFFLNVLFFSFLCPLNAHLPAFYGKTGKAWEPWSLWPSSFGSSRPSRLGARFWATNGGEGKKRVESTVNLVLLIMVFFFFLRFLVLLKGLRREYLLVFRGCTANTNSTQVFFLFVNSLKVHIPRSLS